MDITRIGYTAYQNTAVRSEKASEKKEPDTTGTTAENQAAVQNRDTFVQTGAEKPVTYSRKLTDAQVQQLKDEQAQRMERFIQMLQSMVVKQGQRAISPCSAWICMSHRSRAVRRRVHCRGR